MTFLSMGGAKRPDTCTPLPAGQHLVRLASLKYVAKVGKVVAEFETPDQAQFFTEWLGMDSPGKVGRLQAFMGRLFTLAGLRPPTAFDTEEDFNRAGDALVAGGLELQLVLADDVWEGRTQQVIAGKFDVALLPKDAPRPAGAKKLF